MPIKVLHIISGLRTGGAEIMLYKLLSGTNKSSFENSVISLSEKGNIGFNLYRSESKSGNYVQVNRSLIKGKGTNGQGATYRYADRRLQNGKTYYYKVEYVATEIGGTSVFHDAVTTATPALFSGIGR